MTFNAIGHPFDFGLELAHLRVEDPPKENIAGQPGDPFDVDLDLGSGAGEDTVVSTSQTLKCSTGQVVVKVCVFKFAADLF